MTERTRTEVTGKLDGIRVRDVMTADPVTAPGWWTVETFADHVAAAGIRHRIFPVLSFDGKPVGVVGLATLLVGVVTTTDITRTLELVRLGRRPATPAEAR